MICEYCQIADYNGFCHCGKDGDICAFMRRCQTEHRWKPLESMDKCKLRKEGKPVPKGQYKVRFELKGTLYVEMGDFVREIKNPYGYVPEFVEVVQIDGVYYIKEFAPKVAPKKKPKSREGK